MKPSHQKRIRALGATLPAIVLILIAAPSIRSHGQDPQKQIPEPEVQQLKDRLKQLEQTVEELKAQLNSVEDSKKQPTEVATASPGPDGNAGPAQQSEGDAKPPTGTQATRGESTFQVYGHVMLDAGYQVNTSDPNWFDVLRPTKLPSFPGEFAPSGKTFWGVRQSRFGVKSSTPTRYGDLKTHFEFELFGVGVDAGQTTFRLRHAYGELGQFGAGQTNSPFMDIDVFPNSLEYWGPNGMVFFRNVQFRWMPLKGRNAVTIALERPGASADQGPFANRIELQGVVPKFDLPDLSGNVRFTRDWGHIQASGMLRRIKWRDTNQDQFDLSGSAVGLGLNLSSNLKFSENDIGRFQVVYGKGIENYMNDAPVDVGIEGSNSTDPRKPIRGVALPVLGIVAFLDHNWNKSFSSSAGYSMVHIENSGLQNANAYRRGHYALANLLFYPSENVTIGGEVQWGKRSNFRDGFSSDDLRVQFGFKYNFSKLFKTEQ